MTRSFLHRHVAAGFTLLVVFILSVMGCNRTPSQTLKHKSSRYGMTFGETMTVHLCQVDGKTAALIWFDTRHKIHDLSGGNTNGEKHVFFSKFPKPDGTETEWRCEINDSDGKTGNVKIDAKSYDLAEGSLLLVSSADKDLRVIQLKRDVSSVKDGGGAGLEELYRDPEVKKWLPAAKKEAP